MNLTLFYPLCGYNSNVALLLVSSLLRSSQLMLETLHICPHELTQTEVSCSAARDTDTQTHMIQIKVGMRRESCHRVNIVAPIC